MSGRATVRGNYGAMLDALSSNVISSCYKEAIVAA